MAGGRVERACQGRQVPRVWCCQPARPGADSQPSLIPASQPASPKQRQHQGAAAAAAQPFVRHAAPRPVLRWRPGAPLGPAWQGWRGGDGAACSHTAPCCASPRPSAACATGRSRPPAGAGGCGRRGAGCRRLRPIRPVVAAWGTPPTGTDPGWAACPITSPRVSTSLGQRPAGLNSRRHAAVESWQSCRAQVKCASRAFHLPLTSSSQPEQVQQPLQPCPAACCRRRRRSLGAAATISPPASFAAPCFDARSVKAGPGAGRSAAKARVAEGRTRSARLQPQARPKRPSQTAEGVCVRAPGAADARLSPPAAARAAARGGATGGGSGYLTLCIRPGMRVPGRRVSVGPPQSVLGVSWVPVWCAHIRGPPSRLLGTAAAAAGRHGGQGSIASDSCSPGCLQGFKLSATAAWAPCPGFHLLLAGHCTALTHPS